MLRKPRLQIRLAAKMNEKNNHKLIRKALALAIALEKQEWALSVESTVEKKIKKNIETKNINRVEELEKGIDKLAFTPLEANCRTLEDACYILGIKASKRPSEKLVRQKFRDLASVFHPDAIKGDHVRMSQINQAMQLFKEYNILS